MKNIEIEKLSKSFKSKKEYIKAVVEVSFSIEEGTIFSLLGPNGAGKTTTIKILATLFLPDGGYAKICGYDVVKDDLKVRQNLGTVLPGERTLFWKLSVKENLSYFADLYGLKPSYSKKRIEYLLKRFEIEDRKNTFVEKLSTGLRQRVVLCRALLSDPKVLLLDEPTLGLDPEAARNLRNLILEIKKEGKTILLTTHYMYEADELSDFVAIINKGKIVGLDTPENLKKNLDIERNITISSKKVPEIFIEEIKNCFLTEVYKEITEENLIKLSLSLKKKDDAVSRIIQIASKYNIVLENIILSEPTLEDVFIQKTGKKFTEVEAG
ncbi:MAG TPA: ATP-binding cassette domain-containing protein [Exilispira sp.]|nr:ATP-binding cassette domain-containing protein [Exilispira sp.]